MHLEAEADLVDMFWTVRRGKNLKTVFENGDPFVVRPGTVLTFWRGLVRTGGDDGPRYRPCYQPGVDDELYLWPGIVLALVSRVLFSGNQLEESGFRRRRRSSAVEVGCPVTRTHADRGSLPSTASPGVKLAARDGRLVYSPSPVAVGVGNPSYARRPQH